MVCIGIEKCMEVPGNTIEEFKVEKKKSKCIL